MNRSIRLSYVAAVHNEEEVLAKTVDTLATHLQAFPGSRIILGENGSKDRSREICKELEGARGEVTVQSFSLTDAGLGYALERGLVDALAAEEKSSDAERERHWVAFTGADLPFGFSDLDGLVAELDSGFDTGVVIGSKAHPRTRMEKDWKRTLASTGYSALRKALLRMRTRDPQGTFFIHDRAARRLVGRVKARNYFYTTELVFLAEHDGIPVREVPVTFEGERRPSTVRLWKHGRQMAAQLWDLRQRGA